MSLPADVAEKFGRTFVDFWRLGPRALFDGSAKQQERYFRPYEFLAIAMAITWSILLVQAGQISNKLTLLTDVKVEIDKAAWSGQTIVACILAIFLNSSLIYFGFRWWPIRKPVSFRTVLGYNCYSTASIFLPWVAMGALIYPWIAELVIRQQIPKAALLSGAPIGGMIGLLAYVKCLLPSLSSLSGVSKTRIFWGVSMWSTIIMCGPYVVFFYLISQELLA